MKKRMISFLLALMLIVGLIPATAVTANAASSRATSDSAVSILTQMEGFREKPYKSGGQWYIGYGRQIDSDTLYPNQEASDRYCGQGNQCLYQGEKSGSDSGPA